MYLFKRSKFTSPLPLNSIKIDKRVVQFSEIQTPETTVISFINEGKADKFYHLFKQLLLKNKVEEAFLKLEDAIKFRNDIFTAKFQKFVQKYIDKYNNYQNSIAELNKIVKSLTAVNNALKNNVLKLNVEVSSITNEHKKNQDIHKQNIEKIKKEKEKMKSEIEKLKDELSVANKRLSNKNAELLDLTVKFKHIKDKLDKISSKWFVKIFD